MEKQKKELQSSKKVVDTEDQIKKLTESWGAEKENLVHKRDELKEACS